MTNEHTISTKKLVVIITSAVIASAVTTTFAMLRIANSDHFTIIANAKEIKRNTDDVAKIEQNFVSRAELQAVMSTFRTDIDRLDKNDKDLIQRFDRLLERSN